MGKIKYLILIAVLALAAGIFSLSLSNAHNNKIKALEKQEVIFNIPKINLDSPNPLDETFSESLRLDQNQDGTYKKKKVYLSQVINSDFVFNGLGLFWQATLPYDSNLQLEVRFFNGQGWSEWFLAPPDNNEAKNGSLPLGDGYTSFLSCENSQALQYRVTLTTNNPLKTPVFKGLKFTFIDSISGFKKQKGQAEAAPQIISRALWGADPSLMTWLPEYKKASKIIIHHTAGSNNYTDGAAQVRAIYYYHSVTRGWGDIGYNFLIDKFGNIYEGRYGGADVVGAHVLGYNYGSIGIAMIGTYSDIDISDASRQALNDLCAWKCLTNNIDPLGTSLFVDKNTYNIAGHRDYASTACPGQAFYNTFPRLRNEVNARKAAYSYEAVKVSNFSLSCTNPSLGEEITATFTLTNSGASGLDLDVVSVAVRYNEPGFNRDFPGLNKVNLPAGSSRTFSLKARFNELGNYRAWVSFRGIDGCWYSPPAPTLTFQTHLANLKMVSSLNINPDYPIVDQPATASFKVKNYDSRPAVLRGLGVALRYNPEAGFYPRDFEWKQVEIPPFGEYTYTSSQKLSERGSYYAFVSSLTPDGVWRPLLADPGFSPDKSFRVVLPPDPKITSSLSITPQEPVRGQPVTASFRIKNFGEQPYTTILGVALRYNPEAGFYPRDFEWKQVTLNGGQEYTYSSSQVLNERGPYLAYISQYKDGVWQSILGISGLSSSSTFNVYDSPPDPKITSSLVITPSNPLAGSTVTATFKIKNYGDKPITFPALGVALRLNEPAWNPRDFEWKQVTLNGGQEYTYSSSQVLNETGNYRAFISSYIGGKWITPPALEDNLIREQRFTISASALDQIRISSFNLSTNTPSVGEKVKFQLVITNPTNVSVSLDALGVALRLNEPAWNPRDFGYQKTLLAAGETKSIEIENCFNELGDYRAWISFLAGGRWYNPLSSNSLWLTQTFKTHLPLLKVSQFEITPPEPEINQIVTASFKVKNYDSRPAVLRGLGVALRYNPEAGFYPRDFEWKQVEIPPFGEYTYTSSQKLSERGPYYAFVSSLSPDGVWRSLLADPGFSPDKSFRVVLPPDPKITSSLVITPSNPLAGSTVTATFKIKNYGDKPITFPALGVALRLNEPAWNPRDFEWKQVTLNGGQEYTYSSSQVLNETGNYRAFISSYTSSQGWDPSYPPSLEGGLKREIYFSVNQPQISLPNTPAITITSQGYFQVQDQSGYILRQLAPGANLVIKYSDGQYYFQEGSFVMRTTSYLKVVGVSGAILRLTSYNDIPSWNPSLNDNLFRGALEVRFSSASNKLWVINELPLEDYLKGIAETSSSAPFEHLKVMTVAARSYAYYHLTHGGKYPGEPFHLKNSRNGNGDDQQYKGYGLEQRFPQLVLAVEATKGEVVTYGGNPVITPYFSRSDGRTRSAAEVWRVNWPWCVSVADPDCLGLSLLGHGVGLSAYGSLARAQRGESYQRILGYYYQGTGLGKIDNPNIRIAIYSLSY